MLLTGQIAREESAMAAGMTSNEYLSRIVQSERLKTLKHWPYEEGDGSTCTGKRVSYCKLRITRLL